MRTLYLECYSGISGDMTVAALLDLGASEAVLRRGLESLKVDGYRIEIGRAVKCGVEACDFRVILEDEAHHHHHTHGAHAHEHPHSENCGHGCTDTAHEGQHHEHSHSHGDASQEYVHEHPHSHGEEHHEHPHGHSQAMEHGHSHETHTHPHSHEGHSHVHRNLQDVLAVIRSGDLTPNARQMAEKIFTAVALAEAKVHGKPLEEVHFHEVGAVDSIVDIVGAAICLDDLGITKIIASPLYEGTGTVWCQHGEMPVPAPATLEIVRAHGIPLTITKNQGEMVTPTGAAIVGALCTEYRIPQAMVVSKVGMGAGKKDFAHANILRAYLLEEDPQDEIVSLQANIDDCTGEVLGYVSEELMKAGARDVFFTPVFMKKNRPAYLLTVLCDEQNEEEFTRLLFSQTSTIGVRRHKQSRRVMERTARTVATPLGEIQVKECSYGDIKKTSVEYESAKLAAINKNVPLAQVYSVVNAALENNLQE